MKDEPEKHKARKRPKVLFILHPSSFILSA